MSTLHLDFLDHPPVTLAGPQPATSKGADPQTHGAAAAHRRPA